MTKRTKQENFPYSSMPWKLKFNDSGIETVCYFDCEENMEKYIKSIKLKKNQYKTYSKSS